MLYKDSVSFTPKRLLDIVIFWRVRTPSIFASSIFIVGWSFLIFRFRFIARANFIWPSLVGNIPSGGIVGHSFVTKRSIQWNISNGPPQKFSYAYYSCWIETWCNSLSPVLILFICSIVEPGWDQTIRRKFIWKIIWKFWKSFSLNTVISAQQMVWTADCKCNQRHWGCIPAGINWHLSHLLFTQMETTYTS